MLILLTIIYFTIYCLLKGEATTVQTEDGENRNLTAAESALCEVCNYMQ